MLCGVSCATTTSQDSQIVRGQSGLGGGEEFGIKDATEEEKKKLQEDDLFAWRMVFLFMVASFVRKARGIPEKVQFTWSSLHHRRHTSLKWCPGGTLGTGRS